MVKGSFYHRLLYSRFSVKFVNNLGKLCFPANTINEIGALIPSKPLDVVVQPAETGADLRRQGGDPGGVAGPGRGFGLLAELAEPTGTDHGGRAFHGMGGG